MSGIDNTSDDYIMKTNVMSVNIIANALKTKWGHMP